MAGVEKRYCRRYDHMRPAGRCYALVNLEWIQKIHRDMNARGYSAEAVTHTILRRMHDYVHYITPQFSRSHIHFQRCTTGIRPSFIARDIPTLDESFVVIRFRDPKNVDFPYLLSMIPTVHICPDTIVVPAVNGVGDRMVLTPAYSGAG